MYSERNVRPGTCIRIPFVRTECVCVRIRAPCRMQLNLCCHGVWHCVALRIAANRVIYWAQEMPIAAVYVRLTCHSSHMRIHACASVVVYFVRHSTWCPLHGGARYLSVLLVSYTPHVHFRRIHMTLNPLDWVTRYNQGFHFTLLGFSLPVWFVHISMYNCYETNVFSSNSTELSVLLNLSM